MDFATKLTPPLSLNLFNDFFSVIAQTLPQPQPTKIDLSKSRASSNELKVAQLLANSSAKNVSNIQQDKTNITKRSFVVEMKDKHEKDTLKMKFEKAWNEFIQYLNHQQKPETKDYLNYFQHLKKRNGETPENI